MIVGLGDDDAGDEEIATPCTGCDPRELRRRIALKNIARAQAAGQLGDVDASQLGGLDPSASPFSYSRGDVDGEQADFDGKLNAWLGDFSEHVNVVPKSFINQVDDFVERWRALIADWYLWEWTRAKQVLAFESEWNKLRDQAATYGVATAIAPVTVRVGDKDYRADALPAEASLLDRIATIARWGGLIVGGLAAYKLASELGLVARLGRLVGGGGGGGGVASVARRYGSAKRASNPRRRTRRR